MKLLILDRDGTLNVAHEDFVKSPDEWQPVAGAAEAVARFNHAGWHVLVATSQPGLGRGLFDMAALNAVHAQMHKWLAAAGARVDAVFFCPHAPDETCVCRKPAPGLFEQIASRLGQESHATVVAGNGVAHLQAAARLGAQLHWILPCKAAPDELPPLPTSAAQSQPAPHPVLPPGLPPGTLAHRSLAALADHLLGASGRAQ